MALSIDDLEPIALAVGVAVVVIAVTAMILGNMQGEAYAGDSVINETFNATSDPFTYTVSHASDSGFYQLTSVTCYSDAGSTELSDSACNISDASAGKVSVSSAVDGGDEAVDYGWDYEGTAYSVLGKGMDAMRTFADWFNIIILVSVSAVILGLVMMFKGSFGGRTGV